MEDKKLDGFELHYLRTETIKIKTVNQLMMESYVAGMKEYNLILENYYGR